MNRARQVLTQIALPAIFGLLAAVLTRKMWDQTQPGKRLKFPAGENRIVKPAPAERLVKPGKYATIDLWVDALATQVRVEDLLVLSRQLPPGEDRNQVFRKLAYQWLPLDRQATLDWIESVPDPSERELACGQVANVWATLEPRAASLWVKALPEGPIQAAAAFRLARSIQFSDPSAALAWAIPGRVAPRGDSNLTWLARWAGRNDPDDCLRIIRESGLPAEGKQNLARLAIEDWNSSQAQLGHWDKIRPFPAAPRS